MSGKRPAKATAVARMEDLSSQSRRRHRIDGFVCRPHDLLPAAIWIFDSSASPPRDRVARCDRASDYRMDRSPTEAYAWAQTPRYIIRDRDGAYGDVLVRRLRAMGIWDRPIEPRSPWQNGHTERLIGSIRRDCLDHVVVFGERHLRHLLRSYQRYYNDARTHLSLNKDAPALRAVQAVGRIVANPHLGGLHHQYVRI